MKSAKIYYFLLTHAHFTGRQMDKIHKEWCKRWDTDNPVDEMTEEDVLIEAEILGFIELPEQGWKA